VCLLFLGLLLDIESIPWPPALRKLMQTLNAWFNINLEMASPECSMAFTAIDKMRMTLWAPLVLIVIVLTYGMLRTCINYRDEFRKHKFETDEERSAARAHFMVRELQVWERAASAGTTVFTTCTIFYVRACLRPFKCIEDASGSFMASSPDTKCNNDNQEYSNMRKLGEAGLIVYTVLYISLALALLRAAMMSKRGKQHQIAKLLGYLGFLGDKYEAEFFYWYALTDRPHPPSARLHSLLC
jgi:hypothetical protein